MPLGAGCVHVRRAGIHGTDQAGNPHPHRNKHIESWCNVETDKYAQNISASVEIRDVVYPGAGATSDCFTRQFEIRFQAWNICLVRDTNMFEYEHMWASWCSTASGKSSGRRDPSARNVGRRGAISVNTENGPWAVWPTDYNLCKSAICTLVVDIYRRPVIPTFWSSHSNGGKNKV
jgi:hypothetical protein